MENENIMTVTTTRGELRYTRDGDGFIRMLNPQTIDTYYRLRWKEQPDLPAMGIFCAFSEKQFEEGVKGLIQRGFIKDESELRRGIANTFGSPGSFKKMYAAYDEQTRRIKEECDPQEVYFWEFNNHETPYSWDGDIETMRIIVDTWGYDTAIGLKRYCRSNDKAISQLNKN